MNKEVRYKLFLSVGLILTLGPIILQIYSDIKMNNNEKVHFVDINGNNIFNTYYSGQRDYGVMIFHGMGEDQVSLNMYTSKFVRLGFHVFTTDFSGHGRSSGVIPTGENSDFLLANQVLGAKMKFIELSGLDNSQIFMIGHSMGAKAITYALLLDTEPINGCVLIGAAVFIRENETSWTGDINTTNPNTNVCLVTGKWEDVFTPLDAVNFFNHLSNNNLTDYNNRFSQIFTHDYINSETHVKSLRIIKRLTHTHESMSRTAVLVAAGWIESIIHNWYNTANFEEAPQPSWMNINDFLDFRVWISLFEIGGIFLLLIYAQRIICEVQAKELLVRNKEVNSEETAEKLEIIHLRKYFWFKLPILLGGLIFAVLIGLLIIKLPVAIPYFTLIFLCPIVGYGLMNTILLLLGKLPGLNNKLSVHLRNCYKGINWWSVLIGFILFIIIIIIFRYFINGYLYHIFPLNIRVAWLAFFSVVGSLGFYIVQFELKIIRETFLGKIKYTMLYNFLFLLPFIIFSLFLLFTGTIIFFADGLHDLIIFILIVLVGNLLQQIWKKPYFTALAQSFLFFFLLLPRGQMMLM